MKDATLKELRFVGPRRRSQTPSELRRIDLNVIPQGFKANPGLKLANAFSVTAYRYLRIV
jgi:hypothetical protein